MKRTDPKEIRTLRVKLRRYLKEANDPQAQYALGYRRAQNNYYDKNIQSDFTGYGPDFIKGYKAGIKDARYGRFNDAVTKILTGLGDFLGRWNIGHRK